VMAAPAAAPAIAEAAQPPAAVKAAEPAQPKPAARVKAAKPATKAAKPAAKAKTAPKPAAGARASGLDAAMDKTKTDAGAGTAGLMARPRGGKGDNLKEIKGVGPALEKLLNDIGVWHFDQIAAWKAKDIALVDSRMEGFKGRISRDGWVKQARILAKGGTTEFSERVVKGKVY